MHIWRDHNHSLPPIKSDVRPPDDALVIPTADGTLILNPTPVLRFYLPKPSRGSALPKLQQLWRERETGDPYWRDVPTAIGV